MPSGHGGLAWRIGRQVSLGRKFVNLGLASSVRMDSDPLRT